MNERIQHQSKIRNLKRRNLYLNKKIGHENKNYYINNRIYKNVSYNNIIINDINRMENNIQIK